MKTVFSFMFLIGTFLPIVSPRHVLFFRKDYTYVAEYDAFYKLHWNLHRSSWSSAFLTCYDEGSKLFYPKIKDEWALVKNLTREVAEPPNVTDIFVGLHDEFGLGEFITVDGQTTSSPLLTEYPDDISGITTTNPKCILMNVETGLYKAGPCINTDKITPFICKKIEDVSCPTIDTDYKYIKSLNKCYKINKTPRMWDEAMRNCYMEGGILAVLETKEQAEALRDKVDEGETYFVGTRRMVLLDAYYTVKGQRYDDVYQMNNGYQNMEHDCGAIYSNNRIYTTTRDCGELLPFICEMAVNV